MKLVPLLLALAVVCSPVFVPATHAAGQYLKIDYPASTDGLQIAVTYTLWIPDGVTKVRGVIVHQHGASIPAAVAGDTAAYDLHWQALAKKWDCVLLGPSYHVLNNAIDLTPGGAELWFDPRHGSEKTFLRALDEFAAKSGHPEISKVPWVLWGHSGGGIWSNVMAALHPERVAAMFLRSGTAIMFKGKREFLQPSIPLALYQIPTMANAGVLEKGREPWAGSIEAFQDYRAHGMPIGFAPDPRTAHFTGDSRYLAIPFLDACLAMRLPDKESTDQTLKSVDSSGAWLSDMNGKIAAPAADYKGDRLKAVWLPNEAVARDWMEYVRTGEVSDLAIPPAPFAVKVSKDSGGDTITWDAESGIEGGIGAFVVLRDGHAIARLPERPPDRLFGRPLFQGLSFHDTPEQPLPLPLMRFVDATAKPGVKHTYTIITLSSGGIRSDPSAAVIVE